MQKNRTRLTVPQEGMLWKAALMHWGAEGLHQAVVDLLQNFGPSPIRSSIEYLRREWVGEEVLLVLKNARSEAGIGNPAFDSLPERVALSFLL